jgi:flagellar basal-body rod modification protein FlgD
MSAVSSNYETYVNLGLTAPEESDASSSQLGLEDFMNLLVTELTHQDPTKPMENTELATQVSQFATVSGIGDLNTFRWFCQQHAGATDNPGLLIDRP